MKIGSAFLAPVVIAAGLVGSILFARAGGSAGAAVPGGRYGVSPGSKGLSPSSNRLSAGSNGLSPDTNAMEEQVLAKEREGLEALKAGDVQHFADITAEDAIFVDPQGPATKAEVLSHVNGFTLTGYTITDVKFVAVSANSGLISYKCAETGNSHGHDFAAQVYVSSIWIQRGGKWLCLFSQETPLPKPRS
jgi:ketosteroid isomerase-like protein